MFGTVMRRSPTLSEVTGHGGSDWSTSSQFFRSHWTSVGLPQAHRDVSRIIAAHSRCDRSSSDRAGAISARLRSPLLPRIGPQAHRRRGRISVPSSAADSRSPKSKTHLQAWTPSRPTTAKRTPCTARRMFLELDVLMKAVFPQRKEPGFGRPSTSWPQFTGNTFESRTKWCFRRQNEGYPAHNNRQLRAKWRAVAT